MDVVGSFVITERRVYHADLYVTELHHVGMDLMKLIAVRFVICFNFVKSAIFPYLMYLFFAIYYQLGLCFRWLWLFVQRARYMRFYLLLVLF